nr:rrp15-like protein [Quercus suber]
MVLLSKFFPKRKFKGEAKKKKYLVGEKGHVKPANYLDSYEKFLIGVATKGVVKLFNAVNEAQHAQKGLDPLRYKDAKSFFSALGKPSKPVDTPAKGHTSKGEENREGPAWAPLLDNYMLTNSKLKDWDNVLETTVADEYGRISEDSSSDGD